MNNPEIFVSNEAEDDLDEAFIWYEMQKPGLGVDFILLVEDAFDFICKNPGIFTRESENISRHFITRFPYSIYFSTESEENRIRIIAVLHHRRNPEIWKKRVK